jgi:putative FmdB family regulatory protein
MSYKWYDFTCEACGHTWEDMVKEGQDTPLCVQCYSTKVKRKFPTPMIGGESPYKTLEKSGIPDAKRIFSGPYHSSKTTVGDK